jgi:hypothetical protein
LCARDNQDVSRILALALLLASLVSAETVALSNGVQVQIATSFGNPTGMQTITVDMQRASGNSFYRVFRDQNHLAVFAYELELRLAGSGDRVIINAKPAANEFYAKFPQADNGKPTPTFSEDHPSTIASGQSTAIGVFELEGMGLRVVDTVRVQLDVKSSAAGGRLRFSGLQVYASRKLISGEAPSSVSGKFAMFYVPGRGGFFFSTDAVPGKPFVVAGSINKNKMQFTVDNEVYDVVATTPILSNPDTGEVWIYHDPAYKPAGNWTQDLHSGNAAPSADSDFFIAASDSLSWWLQ